MPARFKKTMMGHWKEIIKGFEFGGLIEGEGIRMQLKKQDPSLNSQLVERAMLPPAERSQAYLDACAKAPHASAATKRSWKKTLDIQ